MYTHPFATETALLSIKQCLTIKPCRTISNTRQFRVALNTTDTAAGKHWYSTSRSRSQMTT